MPQAKRVGIIGGGELNGRLAKIGVIDEIIIDTEPVELKHGIKLFGTHDVTPKLELIQTKQFGGTVQKHYKVAGWL